jgi:hypothetical protein
MTLPTVKTTACLRFVDAYGETVFDRLQMPVLNEELKALRPVITAETLRLAKQRYLERASTWPVAARAMAGEIVEGLSVELLHAHLEQLIRFVSDGIAAGTHHYIRFVGD